MASFHSNIKNLLMGQGFLRSGINAASAISIYSGTQPAASAITASTWFTYNSTNPIFLAHYSGIVWSQGAPSSAPTISVSTFPTASTTVNTGTGAWCIIWTANPLISAMNTLTIPTTSFIVAPISVLSGAGTLRYDVDLNFVQGVAKPFIDGVITGASL
jgi:hypothetical protein